MKLIFEQCFFKKFVATFLAQKNVGQDPRANNISTMNVPSKGKHQKGEIGPYSSIE
jgi:hypothetical protein